MNVLDTTATFEGPSHLRLARPVDSPIAGEVRVIVLLPTPDTTRHSSPDFQAEIGSYYREHPDEPVRDAQDWLNDLREADC